MIHRVSFFLIKKCPSLEIDATKNISIGCHHFLKYKCEITCECRKLSVCSFHLNDKLQNGVYINLTILRYGMYKPFP
jgi:hypothetical protein